ncbi:hypothetical protein BKA69DRAFT_1090218 [Paraphysoderma sedebokerense]|nr:hypothetical protein BKA69DRAFT_1090218 [Paraphysoderma sedebokerense]
MPFIIVKHGAQEEHVFNPNCLVPALLSHIKSKLNLQFPDPIDLATESGEIVDLNNPAKYKEYAKKWLDVRGVYVVVKIVNGKLQSFQCTGCNRLK